MYVGYQIHFSNFLIMQPGEIIPCMFGPIYALANFQFVLWNHCFILSGTLVKQCYLFRLHYEKSLRNCVGWCFPYCIMRNIRETVLITKGVRMCLRFQSKPCFAHTRSTRETTEVLRFSIGCCPTSSVVWLFYWLLPDLAFTGGRGQGGSTGWRRTRDAQTKQQTQHTKLCNIRHVCIHTYIST